MNKTKIMFFDIDGTLLSEKTGKIPDSTVTAIRQARSRGHKMFINTGRCFQNVESNIRSIGFDGFVCGCGTNIIYHDETLLQVSQSPEICRLTVDTALKCGLDIVFEHHDYLAFQQKKDLHTNARKLYDSCLQRGYDLSTDISASDFVFDKFVLWIEKGSDFATFLDTVSPYFECIHRSEFFKEFVPHGFSKASGIRFLLDYLKLPIDHAYAVGDSNNDLSMLDYVPGSIAMGNSQPATLFDRVSYVTKTVEEGGIAHALKHFGFIENVQ